jgi:hypothetical protein
MNHYRLRRELEAVAVRIRRLRCWSALALAWLVTALVGILLWATALPPAGNAQSAVVLLCGVAAALGLGAFWLARAWVPGHAAIARRVEAAFPDLRSCLLAALEQRPELPDGRYGFLQYSVICEALEHAERHPWPLVVSARRLRLAIAGQFAAFTLFLMSLAAAAFWVTPRATSAATTAHGPASGSGEFSVTVEPGDAEIERGTGLLVLARVAGPMPADATLVYQSVGSEATHLPMTLGLNDPVFGVRVASVLEPLEYHVELDGSSTPVYHVSVFEYPRLERADVRLTYPRYTGLEERLVQDVRTVSVVEGTEVTVVCRLNKRVATARWIDSKDGPAVELAGQEDGKTYQATLTPEKSRRLKLDLVDEAGRRNVQSAELAIQVIPNQPPTLKVAFPARDVEVSALEELDTRVTAWDDFGLLRAGITYSLADQSPLDAVLTENAAAQKRHTLAQLIRLEDLHAEPDQLLSYHFWAEDFGPDGSIRRTMSDMYFAEVRHFDEIYRQGQAPPGGQQSPGGQNAQNAQAAQKLAELQKEIINATWKLIRRESGLRLSDAYAGDAEEIALSQAEAREKALGLAETLKDAESQSFLETVLEKMAQALKELTAAYEEPAIAPLPPALAAEQAAYQALLKLRAREFEVVRQRGQSGSGSGQPDSQRDQRRNPNDRSDQERGRLQDLELAKDENRYETQRQAQPQEDRETRQVLSRLSELARRQHDLNERVKDLQSALAEVASSPEREEASRQLQRLEEEQEQVLRDTDELKARMETPENQERMSEEKQQLDEAREQVQRSLEAMQREKVTQAAAAGTRAENEFDELRNEFRRRAARPFSDEMQHMRQAARDLDRREKDLAERLQQVAHPDAKAKSLRDDDGQRAQVGQDLAEQRLRLTKLVDRMRQTIQEAEQTEPLLSERLYDAARNVQSRNLDQSLQAAEGALRRGFDEDAQKLEEAAGRGIAQLREGIERAAESVLGDETEALRRARDELRNLADEVIREVARNTREGSEQPGKAGEQSSRDESRARRGDGADGQTPEEGAGRNSPQSGEPGQDQEQQARGQTGGEEQGQPGEKRGQTAQPGQRPRGQQNGSGREQGASAGETPSGDGQAGSQTDGSQRVRTNRPIQPGTNSPSGGGNEDPTGLGGGRAFGGAAERVVAPIAGNDYLDWSDRLRDVEEMVDDPELRAEAARIRDRARGIRSEVKRHSAPPNWDVVRVQVAEPLVELGRRVSEELLRRNSKQAVVPLDRDPVPPRYSEKTRRYYENLGSGK